jgi:hypothetical protein
MDFQRHQTTPVDSIENVSQVSREEVNLTANSEPLNDSFLSVTSEHSQPVHDSKSSLECYRGVRVDARCDNVFHDDVKVASLSDYDLAAALDAAYGAPLSGSNTDTYILSQILLQDEAAKAAAQDAASTAAISKIMREERESQVSTGGDRKPAFDDYRANTAERFTVEMVHELYRLCLLTKPDDNSEVTNSEAWDPVRSYLLSDNELVRCAAGIRSHAGLTPFHQICRHNPPLDVIELFIACAGVDVVQTRDNAGMLPLHMACIHVSSVDVVDALITLFPESRIIQDGRGATPLHYAVMNIRCSDEVISKVCVESAAAATDESGMLPLHYVCVYKAYFRSATVTALMRAFPSALSTPDQKSRTPIRWLAKTCHLAETLELLKIAITLDPALAKGDIGLSLLSILGECARKVGRSENIQSFLNLLLEYNPEPSARYLALLESLPRWILRKPLPKEKPTLLQMLSRRNMFRRGKKNTSAKDI